MHSPPIRKALISVSDKMGLAGLARGLTDAGIEIYSTGGTRRHLESEGFEVKDVADYTGFPEMMDGRVKTLHPKIFAGILARHDREDDLASLSEHDIATFELVVVNLYPFEATLQRPGVTWEEVIEQIDIGGPSLVRAAAKNHAFTTITTRPDQYSAVLEEIESYGSTTLELRKRLAKEAFQRTAAYDRCIADYFSGTLADEVFPARMHIDLKRRAVLRYGENPHQQAALYAQADARGASLVSARQLGGKELSFNNLLDLDAALTMVRTFPHPACVVIKHNNPCGAAVADSLGDATAKAMAGDPVSAFGSILAFNRTVDEETAAVLCEPGLFVEAIVAPDYAAAAVGMLTTRPKWRNNVRLMQVGPLDDRDVSPQFRQIEGGMLVQDADLLYDLSADWQCVTENKPSAELLKELEFGWNICRHVKSNAITLSRDLALVGVGAGQMSRVDSVEISIKKAGERAQGSVLASDAFFPFPDSIQAAAEAGIAAVVQPGGSKRDEEVIEAANQAGLPMLFTGKRHFKH